MNSYCNFRVMSQTSNIVFAPFMFHFAAFNLNVVVYLLWLKTSGVNLINVLLATFTLTDTKSARKTIKLWVFLALSGSAQAKTISKMLMKLKPSWLEYNVRQYMTREVSYFQAKGLPIITFGKNENYVFINWKVQSKSWLDLLYIAIQEVSISM